METAQLVSVNLKSSEYIFKNSFKNKTAIIVLTHVLCFVFFIFLIQEEIIVQMLVTNLFNIPLRIHLFLLFL